MTKVRTGGGKFDHDEPTIYFVAGHNIVEIAEVHPWNLVAANEVKTGIQDGCAYNELSERTTKGKVLFDSGIFWLSTQHAKQHGMTMDQALALAPSELEGFDQLLDTYVQTVREYEGDLWGYIELDQGGAVNKRKTRKRLEDMGLRPIPVYHPLVDGWDYFDELCKRYDRICFGNVVQASPATRKHLLATLWERRRRYPDVWVHVLGLTPSELVIAYPVSSADSSTFLSAIRYGAETSGAYSMGDRFGRFASTFSYDPALHRLEDGGQRHAVHFLASEARFMQASMRTQLADLQRVFGDDAQLPKPDKREQVRT